MNGKEKVRISQTLAGLRAECETTLRNGQRPSHTLAETIADEISLRFFQPSIRTHEHLWKGSCPLKGAPAR
jgi:hypothetical protein